jgi:glycosyltransferase involved in cell wall biosynthesis
VANLDRSEFTPFVIFSRPEQLDYFRRNFHSDAEAVVIRCASLIKDTSTGRAIGAAAKRIHSWVARPVYGLFGLLDLAFVYAPYVVRMAAFARGKRIDLIHQNNGFDFGAIFLALIMRRPLLAYQRGAEWNSRLVRFLARFVDFYIANSQQTWRDLRTIGVPPEKMTVITPPVDLSKYDYTIDCSKQREEFGITESDLCFGILGTLLEWKGQRVFIKAARRVIETLPNARAFVIGGVPDGGVPAYERELKESAASLGIADKVVFTGFRHDMPEMIQMQRLIVHASLTPEPFGRVIIESMAMRKPVIASAEGGPLEIIDDGINGFLVGPGNDAELASKITLLLRNPVLAASLGQEAYAKTRRSYAVESHVEAVAKIYRDVLGRSERSATGSRDHARSKGA